MQIINIWNVHQSIKVYSSGIIQLYCNAGVEHYVNIADILY